MSGEKLDETIVLVAWLAGREWLSSDEVESRLRMFGIDLSRQKVTAALTRMASESCPAFERRKLWVGFNEYRVTDWGQTWLRNTHDRLAALPLPSLPVPTSTDGREHR